MSAQLSRNLLAGGGGAEESAAADANAGYQVPTRGSPPQHHLPWKLLCAFVWWPLGCTRVRVWLTKARSPTATANNGDDNVEIVIVESLMQPDRIVTRIILGRQRGNPYFPNGVVSSGS